MSKYFYCQVFKVNKTKYFRLRLKEIPLRDPDPDADLRQSYGEKIKIQCFTQTCATQTNGPCDSLSS